MKEIKLLPYKNKYFKEGQICVTELQEIFAGNNVLVEHVGSTAIIGIKSKPVIDIAVAIDDLKVIERLKSILEQNGYIFSKQTKTDGEDEVIYKRYKKGIETHSVTFVLKKSNLWKELVVFKDYLNAFPSMAKKYEQLKIEMEKHHDGDNEYTKMKRDMMKKIIKEAND